MPAFTRLRKSKVGTIIIAGMLTMILVGFAMSDIRNFGSGDIGFGGSGGGTLVKVGDQKITDREMNEAMQRRLAEVRQQKPDATYADIANDFRIVLNALIDQRTLIAFADKFGFHVSKRLIDAEIANLPGTKGLDGKFSDTAYQGFLAQRRLKDAEVREIILGGMLQRFLVTPVAANAQVPVGLATPYASMLLESREGEAAVVPAEAFARGLVPTDAQLQQFYTTNRARYTVPEQRTLRIAQIGPAAVASIAASEQEVAAYYNANKATYASNSSRNLSQVVVPDQKTAAAIAARAKGGATLAAAAAPAGSNAAVSDLSDQRRADYASAAGDKVAAAVFAAPSGAVVGPIQSDFGWVVVKVNSVREQGGKTLDQARGEIAAKLTAEKRKGAIEDLVAKVEDNVSEGANFGEAAANAKLTVVTTPMVMANGASRANASVRLPQNLAPAIKAGFEIAPTDEPEVVSLGQGQGYALVAPATVIPAAPAPLAQIKAVVTKDWVNQQSMARAKAAAEAIAAKVNKGASLAEAVRGAGVALPAPRPIAARRLQLANAQGKVPSALQMLFSLAQGKTRTVADSEGRGFFVVKAVKVTPGNALLQPTLITRMQSELREGVGQEYASQFIAAMQKELGMTRNSNAIAKLQLTLLQSGKQ